MYGIFILLPNVAISICLIQIDDFTFTLKYGDQEFTYTLEELKTKFESVEIPVTIQCAGNRRSEFNQQERGVIFLILISQDTFIVS